MLSLGIIAEIHTPTGGGTPTSAAFVQSEYVSSGSASSAGVAFPGGTYSRSITAGNCLLVYVQIYQSAQTATVGDNLGNTYTLVSGPDDNAGEPARRYLYICNGVTGSPSTVSAHLGGGSNFMMVEVTELSGVRPISPVDQLAFAPFVGVSTTQWKYSTINTIEVNEIALCFFGSEQNYSTAGQGPGWTETSGENDGGQGQLMFGEYQLAPTIGAYTGKASLSIAQTLNSAAYTLSIRGH